MPLILYFGFGFLASFLGSLPVGPVNLSMVDTRIHGGSIEATKFSLCAAFVEVIQSIVAIFLGTALFERMAIKTIFNISVLVIMVGLGIFYLQKKNTAGSRPDKFGSSGFLKGTLIGFLNPQGILFYVFLLTLFHVDMVVLTEAHILVGFLVGIFIGKGLILIIYGRFGFYLSRRIAVMIPRLNKFIGSILIFLAFISFVKDLVL